MQQSLNHFDFCDRKFSPGNLANLGGGVAQEAEDHWRSTFLSSKSSTLLFRVAKVGSLSARAKMAIKIFVHIWGGSERKSMYNVEKWRLRGKWVQYEIICLILFFENMHPCEKKFIFDHKCNFGPIRPPRNAKIGFNPVQK